MIRVIESWVGVLLKQQFVCGCQAHRSHRWTLCRSLPTLRRVLLQPGCRRLHQQGASTYFQEVTEANWLPSCLHLADLACSMLVSEKSEPREWSPAVCCTSSEANGGSPLCRRLSAGAPRRLSQTGDKDSSAIRMFTCVRFVLLTVTPSDFDRGVLRFVWSVKTCLVHSSMALHDLLDG